MGRRRSTTPKEIRDLPPFTSSCGGVNLRSMLKTRGTWQLHCSGRTRTISCQVRLSRYQEVGRDPYWALHISRVEDGDGRLSRQFEATVRYYDRVKEDSDTDAPEVRACVGTAKGWADAIDVVGTCGDVHLACAATGAWTYGDGARDQWGTVRVFRVKYPWRDAAEPNAVYTPFHLVEPFGFDAESDGAVVSCFELKHTNAKVFAERAGANAFLTGPKKNADGHLQYRLYHRDDMTKFDVIDIDDWRARIIASTRD